MRRLRQVEFTIAAGSAFYIGRPAKPMPQSFLRAVSELLGSVKEVIEAHLPQIWVPSTMTDAAPVLVVVLQTSAHESVAKNIAAGVAQLLGTGRHIDIWWMDTASPMLPSVRAAACGLFRRTDQLAAVLVISPPS